MTNPVPPSSFDKLQSHLDALQARVPELPVHAVLLSRLLLHLGRGIAGMLDQQIRPFGLGEAEFRVLTALFSQPQGTAHPGDLCARTSQSPANMSRIADVLVGLDLITRVLSAHDRRKMVLRITPRGEELVQRLLPVLCGPLRDMVGDLSEAEQVQLIGQLKRLGLRLETVLARTAAEPAP